MKLKSERHVAANLLKTQIYICYIYSSKHIMYTARPETYICMSATDIARVTDRAVNRFMVLKSIITTSSFKVTFTYIRVIVKQRIRVAKTVSNVGVTKFV